MNLEEFKKLKEVEFRKSKVKSDVRKVRKKKVWKEMVFVKKKKGDLRVLIYVSWKLNVKDIVYVRRRKLKVFGIKEVCSVKCVGLNFENNNEEKEIKEVNEE